MVLMNLVQFQLVPQQAIFFRSATAQCAEARLLSSKYIHDFMTALRGGPMN
jgi:hypothetical protein